MSVQCRCGTVILILTFPPDTNANRRLKQTSRWSSSFDAFAILECMSNRRCLEESSFRWLSHRRLWTLGSVTLVILATLSYVASSVSKSHGNEGVIKRTQSISVDDDGTSERATTNNEFHKATKSVKNWEIGETVTWKVHPYDRIPHDKFPSWLDDYIKLHAASVLVGPIRRHREPSLFLRSNATFLCWFCDGGGSSGCGGIGDRINGIITSFYLALVTNRTLIIKTKRPFSLDRFLSPRKTTFWDSNLTVHWDLQRNEDHSYVLSRSNITKIIASDNWHEHSVLWEPQNLPRKGTNVLLTTNLNRPTSWWNTSSFGFHEHAGKSVFPEFVRQRMYGLAFWSLFAWSNAVVRRSDEIRTQANLTLLATEPGNSHRNSSSSPPNETNPTHQRFPTSYIGVHLRTGNGTGVAWDNDPVRHALDLRDVAACISLLQAELQAHCHHSVPMHAYIASDDVNSRQRLANLGELNGTLRYDPKIIPFHVDKSRVHGDGAEYEESYLYERHLETWAELKILTEATCILTSSSGFSKIASLLRLDQQPRCSVPLSQCQQASKAQNGEIRAVIRKTVSVLTREECHEMVLPDKY